MSPMPPRLTRLTAAVVLVTSLLAGPWAPPASADGTTLHGTWLVQVRLLTSCTGGAPLPSFWSMLSFAEGGTLTGSTLNSAFAAGQRGPDLGSWSPAPGGGFVARSLAFIEFTTPASPPASPGFLAGAQMIDQRITLLGDGTFSSDATVTFFDANAVQYRQGCAVATGRRFR